MAIPMHYEQIPQRSMAADTAKKNYKKGFHIFKVIFLCCEICGCILLSHKIYYKIIYNLFSIINYTQDKQYMLHFLLNLNK